MSDSEDDFVTYGNALEPLDEDNLPRKKPATIEEQFAYDAQGRRRFHGAFTGGFSAGYFNTVGTRDGWRPQQFKSTRSNKASNVAQCPEDFMDEEDTGEFGFAPTGIRATQGYTNASNKGTKRERSKNDSTGPIPGVPVLKDLLKPVRERVGVTLLMKMGWKPGQGVGPRLTKREKKLKKQQNQKIKIYGCALPSQENKQSESESDLSDDEYANITFAPDDYEPFRCNPKDNYFGIGYSGLDRRPILSQHINLFDAPTFSVKDKNKKLSIKGQAFGVGAFEAEDDDIYAREDMSSYDFTLGPERKSKSRWSKEEKPNTGQIEGFVSAKEKFPQKKVFAAPTLPKDFKPVHKVKKSRFSPIEKVDDLPKRHQMNAESRAKIINDDRPSIIDSTTTAKKNTSVAAQLITRTLNLHGREQTAERQKLEQTKIKKTAMSWLDKLSSTQFVRGETIGTDPKIQGTLQDASSFSNQVEENISSEETILVKPSFSDLDKQRRFEQFLNFSESERKLKFPTVQPLSMTEWERDQEFAEFEKAARLSEKIDSSSRTETEKNEKKKEDNLKGVDLQNLSTENRLIAAAKMKQFGCLTRTIVEWKPAKLVCVRFNIAEPLVGVADDQKKKKKYSIFDSLSWNEVAHFEKGKNLEYDCEPTPSTSNFSYVPKIKVEKDSEEALQSPEESKVVSEKEKAFEKAYQKVFKTSTEGNKSKEIETELEEEAEEPTTATNIQEKKDLYKSIFLSSSDESESETEESKSIDDEKLKAALIGKSAAALNVQRNTSPPRGIFAKLDFDSLLKRPEKMETLKETTEEKSYRTEEKPNTSKNDEEDFKVQTDEEDLPPDVYGPALPKLPPQTNDPSSQKPIFSGLSKKVEDEIWVEKSRDKKKSKKEKKKHKHKERSRSKSRKKSKKEKKH